MSKRSLFDDFTPTEIQRFWVEQLARDDAERPDEITAETAPAETAFGGDQWDWAAEQNIAPNMRASVNYLFAAFKGFMPQVMARLPKPSAMNIEAPPEYAKLHNKLKGYRDREFGSLGECRASIQDAFMRGSGAVYHDRDAKRGLARTTRFDPHNLYWDANATSPADAKHMIQRCTMYRWEFARRFGAEIADKITPKEQSVLGPQGKKALDVVEYYQAWSKHDDDFRLFVFHRECQDYYLNESEGRPGEPWPFVWDEEDWPISMLVFQRKQASTPWGFSYYEASKGPLHYTQFMISYILAATKKFAHQTVVAPRSMAKLVDQIMSDTEHLNAHLYDLDELGGRGNVKDVLEVIQFPDLNKGLFDALQVGREAFETVVGFNAMTNINPGQTETATEAMRLSQTAETRMSEDVNAVNTWLKKIWDKETQIDCKYAPRKSVVQVVAPDAPDTQPSDAVETTLQPQSAPMTDVPYQEAILLEKGVGDVAAAQERVAAQQEFETAAQTMAAVGIPPEQMPAPPPLDPAIAVRQARGVPLEAKCEILEPGIEAYVGVELGQFWIEGMSPRQIRAMVELRFQQGSTTKMGHVADFNEAMMVFKDAWPILMQFQMFPEMSELWNFLMRSLENFDLDPLLLTPQRLQEAVIAMQQAQMEQEMAMQQQQAGQQAQQQEADAASVDKQQQAKADQQAQAAQQKAQQQQQASASKEKSEQRRERSTRERDFLKMAADDARAMIGQ